MLGHEHTERQASVAAAASKYNAGQWWSLKMDPRSIQQAPTQASNFKAATWCGHALTVGRSDH